MKTIARAAAVVGVALAVGWAGGRGASRLADVSVMVLCIGLAFVLQWVAFVPAYLRQTERFYDLVGSLTYITVTGFALVASGAAHPRAFLLAGLVIVWAGRLGIFLFQRIRERGSDGRFDDIKPDASRFFMAWTLQGLWVSLTACAALAAITALDPAPFGALDLAGLAVWLTGFAIEVVADAQKSRFREEHPKRFVDTGIWAWSRHPNYFGEIVLWIGIAIIAASTLRGWQWVTLVSPVFVAFLLLRVSGVPMLEARADERWGHLEDYRRYKANTPMLIPLPPGGAT